MVGWREPHSRTDLTVLYWRVPHFLPAFHQALVISIVRRLPFSSSVLVIPSLVRNTEDWPSVEGSGAGGAGEAVVIPPHWTHLWYRKEGDEDVLFV